MFLATTALDQYWEKDQKILFLGDWCIPDDQILKDLDYEVLPYHWRDTKKMEKDSEYLYDMYTGILPEVARFMNSIHSKSFSERYWMMLLGPWLWHFIELLFDRYCSIISAVKNCRELNTMIVEDSHAPFEYLEFNAQSDKVNFFLFSEIIRVLNLSIKTEFVNLSLSNNSKKEKGKENLVIKNQDKTVLTPIVEVKRIIRQNVLNLANRLKKLLGLSHIRPDLLIRALFGQYWNNYFDMNIPITLSEKMELNKKLRQINYSNPKEISLPDLGKSNIDKNIRCRRLDVKDASDEFERLLSVMLVTNMPMEYVENYENYRAHVLGLFPKRKLKVISTRSPSEGRPLIRFYVAEKVANGTKLLSCQHGGGYGVNANINLDKYEWGLCDKYLTWGSWTNNLYKEKLTRFYITKRYWIRNYKYEKEGNILLIGASCRKYFYSFQEGQLPTYNPTHVDFNKRLIRDLDKDAYVKLLYRFHNQMGYNEVNKILSEFSDINTSLREDESHFYRLINEARLSIITANFTTFLQTFTVNHPTVLLWDPEFIKIRKSARKYYDLLNEAGILYYSPELCAKKINEIYNNPMEWWMDDRVQSVKNEFCEQFCRNTDDLAGELAKVVNEMRQ